jgi:hypothetical protein
MITPQPITASKWPAAVDEESSEDEMERFQIRGEDMDTVIRHQDVPEQMTCKFDPNLSSATFNFEGRCGRTNDCITCAGMANSAIKHHFFLGTSEIVRLWHLMDHGSKRPTTAAGRIDYMATGMTDIKKERKKLAKIGAYRISRKDGTDILKARDNMDFFSVMMMESQGSADFYGLGYVMYTKLADDVMAMALDQYITNTRTKHLTRRHKANIVECLMALGILYQRNGSVDKELEGIMVVVDALEDMVRDSLGVMRVEMENGAEIEWRREMRAKREAKMLAK